MAKRMNPRIKKNEYLVKWEGKPQTWEPMAHLETCKDLIENFEVLLAKQKEMRAKSQLQQQQQGGQPSATSTPTSVMNASQPMAVSTPNRPERSSKAKAISNVKQWTGGNKSQDEIPDTPGKRKAEEEDDYEDMDGDDEDYQLESNWEKKKMAQQLGQTGIKKIRTDSPGQNGNVRMIGGKQDMQIGATLVRKVVGSKSPDAIMASQKQTSGVFKKSTPGVGTGVVKKPGEGQVRIVEKKDQIQSGIVRVNQGSLPTGQTTIVRQTAQSRVVPKPAQIIRPGSGTGTVVRTAQAVQNQQKTLAQKIIQRSPANKGSPVVQKSSPQPASVVRRSGGAGTIVRRQNASTQGRIVKKAVQEEEDDGIQDPFPKDLPPIEAESESPPPPLTLCPITGKVLGQAEGEAAQAAAALAEEQEADPDQHQITQLLANEDGTPIYITGDDGTMYQVAGKNAKGETILVSTNAEGEQTCVLLPADQDLLAGLPGIQTSDVSEAAVEAAVEAAAEAAAEAATAQPMTVDAAVAEAVAEAVANTEQGQEEAQIFAAKEGDEASQESQGTEDATQPLSVAVGGESGDSQDGQITAEIVQADEPSPGERNFRFSLRKIFV